jgi:hypothetical protein
MQVLPSYILYFFNYMLVIVKPFYYNGKKKIVTKLSHQTPGIYD